jgi:hypothetical protein
MQGDSTSSRRTITQTGNATHFTLNTANKLRNENLVFRNSNATKNEVFTSSAASIITFGNCIIGASDGTNCPKSIGIRTASSYFLRLYNTSAIRLTSVGVSLTASTLEMFGSEISRCGGAGVTSTTGTVTLYASIVSHNSGDGISFTLAPTRAHIMNSTIHGNTGDGIDLAGANNSNAVFILNNQITANGAFGLTLPGTQPHDSRVEFNNFGNASDSTNNTSGAANGLTLGSSNTTIAPSYTDSSSGVRNFAIGSAAKATGFPPSSSSIGAGQTLSISYVDIGAVQRQESAGGSLMLPRAQNGGYSA